MPREFKPHGLLIDTGISFDLTFVRTTPVITGNPAIEGSGVLTDTGISFDLTFVRTTPVITGNPAIEGSGVLTDSGISFDLTFVKVTHATELMNANDLFFTPFDVNLEPPQTITDTQIGLATDLFFTPFDVNLEPPQTITDTQIGLATDLFFTPFDYTENYDLVTRLSPTLPNDLFFTPFDCDFASQPSNTGVLTDTPIAFDLTFERTYRGVTFDLNLVTTELSDTCTISCIPPSYDFPQFTYTFGPNDPVRLLEQYRNSSSLKFIVEAPMAHLREMERLAFEMLHFQYINNAFGKTLDMIGAIFLVSRGSLNDSEYRIAIIKRAANRGIITPDNIIRMLKGFYGVLDGRYCGAVNGNMLLALNPANIGTEYIEELVGAGVGVTVIDYNSTLDLNVTEGSDTCSFGATYSNVPEEVQIVATEGADVAVFNCATVIGATFGTTEGGDICSFLASPNLEVVISAMEGYDVVSISTVGAWDATLSVTEASDTASFETTITNDVGVTFEITETADSVSFEVESVTMPSSYSWASGGAVGDSAYGIVRSNSNRVITTSFNGNGTAKYTDNEGTTWGSLSNASIYYSGAAYKLANGRLLYTKAATPSVMYSDDNGATWTSANPGIDYGRFIFQSSSGRVFITSYTESKYAYSDNNGTSWSTSTGIGATGDGMVQCANGRLIVIPDAGTSIYYSDNDGSSWSSQNLGFTVWTYNQIRTSTNRIVCLFRLGPRYSDDNGATWNTVTLDSTYAGDQGQTQMYQANSGILVTVFNGRVHYSWNDGANWYKDSALEAISANIKAIDVRPSDGRIIAINGSGNSYIGTPNY